MKLNIAVIGINYESNASALQFATSLKAIKNNPDAELKVILVDNSDSNSSGELSQQLKKVDDDIIYIKSPSNVGYFGGARIGYDYCVNSNHVQYDWFIISNVDIIFSDDRVFSFFKELLEISDVGIVAPSVYSHQRNADMNPNLKNRPTKLRMLFYKWIFRYYYSQRFYGFLAIYKYRVNSYLRSIFSFLFPQINSSRIGLPKYYRIYSPIGACIAFSRIYFQKGGTLNHPAFLYSEESFIAEEALKYGLNVVYLPSMRVQHYDHVSTSKITPRLRARYVAESSSKIYDLYFKR